MQRFCCFIAFDTVFRMSKMLISYHRTDHYCTTNTTTKKLFCAFFHFISITKYEWKIICFFLPTDFEKNELEK